MERSAQVAPVRATGPRRNRAAERNQALLDLGQRALGQEAEVSEPGTG